MVIGMSRRDGRRKYKKRGKMSIKFIHCADVHLGSPLVAASKEKKDLLNDFQTVFFILELQSN